MRCASAGHPSPLIGNRQTGNVEELFGALRGNPALGLLSESDYTVFERPMHKDDVILLYTDGVVEALNRSDQFYGKERLVSAIRRNLKRDLGTFTQIVLEDVLGFSNIRRSRTTFAWWRSNPCRTCAIRSARRRRISLRRCPPANSSLADARLRAGRFPPARPSREPHVRQHRCHYIRRGGLWRAAGKGRLGRVFKVQLDFLCAHRRLAKAPRRSARRRCPKSPRG